jgi:hypothetical protein
MTGPTNTYYWMLSPEEVKKLETKFGFSRRIWHKMALNLW